MCPRGGKASWALGFLVGGLKALKFNVFFGPGFMGFCMSLLRVFRPINPNLSDGKKKKKRRK